MLINYQLNLHYNLSSLTEIIPTNNIEIDNYLDTIVQIIFYSSRCNIPKAHFVPHIKPYWTSEVKKAHKNARQKRKIWVNEGKPRGMVFEAYKNYKTAKSEFRSTQQKAIYDHENNTFAELNNAAEHDIRLFWRLFKETKGKKSNICYKLKYNNVEARDPQTIAYLFSDYFKMLYSSVNAQTNSNYSEDTQTVSETVDVEDIIQAVKTLKKKKAPGIDKIQNEHIIYGGRTLYMCICNLYNAIIRVNYIPGVWKTGLLIPIYKGNPKAKDDPDSYRAVSLLPTLYKLFEKIIDEKIRVFLTSNQIQFPSKQQQGFQKQLSSITVSFNLHEAIYNTLELNKVAYIALLDLKKAFDSVSHNLLFQKLEQLNIPKWIIKIIAEAYTNIKSIVFINGIRSNPFYIRNGVRQGGVLSSLLFLIFIDSLLKELETSSLGTAICDINAGNPTLADDISLIAMTPVNLQKMIEIAQNYVKKWLLQISHSKSFVMMMTASKRNAPQHFTWKINSQPLKVVNVARHVGILMSSNLKPDIAIADACQRGRAAFHSTFGFASKTQISINPSSSLKLYRSVVQPAFLYGCEMWHNMTQTKMKEIEVFHHFCLKKIQYLPTNTRSAMCQSLLGVGSLVGEIDKRKLLFFHKITNLPDTSLTKKIFLRRLFLYFQRQHSLCQSVQMGFIPDLYKILSKYRLLKFLDDYMQNIPLPTKFCWKRIIRGSIHQHESKQMQDLMQADPDFSRYKQIYTNAGLYHLWKIPTTISELRVIHFSIKCITLVPQRMNQVCCYCNYQFTDLLLHIVTSCQLTLHIRNVFLEFIVDHYTPTFSVYVTSLDNEDFLQFLLGKTSKETETLNDDEYKILMMLSANFIISCSKQFYG